MSWSYPKFRLFRDEQRVFESVTLTLMGRQYNLTGENPEVISGDEIDGQYLPTLGIQVQRGGNFPIEEDAHPGARALALISDRLWHRRFGADPQIVGKSIALEGRSYEIVGVTPPGFLGLSGQADVLVPITASAGESLIQPDGNGYTMVARRKSSVSRDEALRAVAVVGAAISAAFPSRAGNGAWSATARDLDGMRLAPNVRQALLLLFGAVLLVLLIAYVNLASLLLGRAHARRREIAVRLALGARRERLVRLLVTEGVLLSLLGGLVSIALAWGGAFALAHLSPDGVMSSGNDFGGGISVVDFSSVQLDSTALAFTFGVAMISGVLFGLVPALKATRPVLLDSLKEGAAMAGRARAWLRFTTRQLLVVSEVALALVLLAGSGLMIRSLGKLLAIDAGFDARNVLTLRVSVPEAGFVRDAMPTLYTQLTSRLGALPGVIDVALSDCPPLNGFCGGTRIAFLGEPPVQPSERPMVGPRFISPTWVTTMRVPIRAGRAFTDADRMGAPKVVLVSETAAHTFWPNDSPVGKRIGVSMGGFDTATVVGVVGDVRQRIEAPNIPEVYLPYAQSPGADFMVFVRSSGDAMALTMAVRNAIHEVAPSYPLYDVQTMTARVNKVLARTRYSAVLLTLFAGVALVLAVVGIYGVMSFMVAQRTREVGIRMALGAAQGDVLRIVIGEGVGLAAAGAVVGLVGAIAATRVLRAFVFGVETWDPVTYIAIVALLGVAAAVASWIPARRAMRVSPTEAIRYE
jgi:putative ABC transport system permease protein